jgi:uncharacterized repeat protein (TIGR01451 family)
MKLTLKKVAAILAVIGIVVAVPVTAMASWSPDRPALTYNGPGTPGADHVVFNSFTNTPSVGDERIFFAGKDAANTANGGYQDAITVNPNQEILLRVYIHNNADPSLNASGAGIARNTKVRIFLPTASDRAMRAISYISADNANPGTVSDTVDFNTAGAGAFSLSYVAGSATMYNNAHPAGTPVNDSIVGAGAPVGYEQMDGNLPGCFQYAGLVTIKVKVNSPSIGLTKQVTTPGSTNWQPKLDANVGDTTSWLLHYSNTSKTTLNHVIVKDQLPAHLQVVPGSVTLIDPNHPNGQTLSDTGVFTTGVDVGSLGVGGGGNIRYRTTVKNDFAATDCTPSIVNNATASAEGVTEVKASAQVNVKVTCKPVTPPTPVTPLPATGPEAALGGMLGTGALGYAAVSYRRSKQAVIDAIKGNKLS